MQKIDDKTYVSFPLIASLVSALIGAVIWLTTIYNIAQASLSKAEILSKKYDEMSIDQNAVYKSLSETNQRLARIEGKVDSLNLSKQR